MHIYKINKMSAGVNTCILHIYIHTYCTYVCVFKHYNAKSTYKDISIIIMISICT